jgi:hypothetical protein
MTTTAHHDDVGGRAAPRLRDLVARVPFLLSIYALLVGILVVADAPSAIRGVPVLVFVMAVPGLALLRCWDLARGWLGVALVVTTSVALATVLVAAQLALHLWSPTGSVLGLVLVTVCAEIARYLPRTTAVSLVVALAAALLYPGLWSPAGALAALALVTGCAVLVWFCSLEREEVSSWTRSSD